MKNFYPTSCFVILFLVGTIVPSYGQIPGSKKAPTGASGGLEKMTPLEKPQTKKPSAPVVLPPVKPTTLTPQFAEYLHPGILVSVNGKWEGSDHLLNLPNNIGVYITIVRPQEDKLAVTQGQLHNEVAAIFGRANIKPVTLVPEGRPPLPAFEIEIFLYPVERGYAASVDGRLFESVSLERFKMDPNMAFQAITWEKQLLIVGPTTTMAGQLTRAVQEIANAFTERFSAYERIKKETYR